MSSSLISQHSEWLSLVEISGPFLTLPVLKRALPQGLDPTPLPLVDDLRVAWKEVGDDDTLNPRWIRWVLNDLLELPGEVLKEGAAIGPSLTYVAPEHGVRLRPDFAIVAPEAANHDKPARMLVMTLPSGTSLDERLADSKWSADAIDRMAELCRGTGVRLGLVTNGEHWTIVDAPVGGATGAATWDANLWLEERLTLDAFTTLLGVRRFFSVAKTDTLDAMLAESANAEAEVTDQLGRQVRSAVELLVDAMSRANRDRGGHLFDDLTSTEVYEAAVTVMMRLVFLLSAEERGLFLLGDETYDATYAVSTLRGQLEEEANTFGEEIIARRTDAWYRLLATFRMVFGGAQHENLRLPAYGGSLFDPDRFTFLEGRHPGEPWRSAPSNPLPIDNRTVLHILGALQILSFKDRRGVREARRLSFRALDVEQIGHVYEGLLDHSAVRVDEVAVGLVGKKEPEIALELIETAASRGAAHLVDFLSEETGLSRTAADKALQAQTDAHELERLTSACDNDRTLADRIAPYLALLRRDLADLPVVYLPNSMYVTQSTDRRSSGTYYTPRVLAEEIVQRTLEPLVYSPGPANGADPTAWTLMPSTELLNLKICDMAMGSGAFLVATCRYLSARLREAWEIEAVGAGDMVPLAGDASVVMPLDEVDKEVLARRLVADSCLYGVDRNPMAVEMAKLSMWLITLAKDRPFTFVDHALRCGDSLLGITDLRQLDCLHLDPTAGRKLHGGSLFDPAAHIEPLVKAALHKRRELEAFPVLDVRDADRKQQLLNESSGLLDQLKVIGNVVVGAALSAETHGGETYENRLLSVATEVAAAFEEARSQDDREQRLSDLALKAEYWLDEGRPAMTPDRRCLHWPLEFPEVFLDRSVAGFDAVVGNPPFLGGSIFGGAFGDDYRAHIVRWLTDGIVGRSDLCAYFFSRAGSIVGTSGLFGLIATSSIGEGHTRLAGLARLTGGGFSIFRARTSIPWPTNPGLRVAMCWLARSTWTGEVTLNGEPVAAISSYLTAESDVDPIPIRSGVSSFRGIELRGSGFILTPSERAELLALEPKASKIVRPFFGGADLFAWNGNEPVRWVIDFREAGDDARRFPVCFARVTELVKPIRDAIRGKLHEEKYWIFYDKRAANFEAVNGQEHLIVRATDSSTWAWELVPARYAVLGSKVLIIMGDGYELFGQLQSELHFIWAERFGSKIGEGMAYRPSAVLNTYPVQSAREISEAAQTLKQHRDSMRATRNQGLTKIYGGVHSEVALDEDVVYLRECHAGLDYAVMNSYGWDLDLYHGFYETRLGLRYTVSPLARAELLERLVKLNHERHRDEEPGEDLPKAQDARRRKARESETLF